MAEDSVDVIFEGKLFATIFRDAPPEKQVKLTKKRRKMGGDEERFEEFDKGHKLHAHSDNADVHATYFLGSQRAKVSVPDHTRPGNYQKFLRGLMYKDIEGLFQACGRLLDRIDDYNTEPEKKQESQSTP